jgi:hypothetical protein
VVCSLQIEIKNPEMGLHSIGIKPPRHFVPPLLSLRAGGEITPPELAEFQNEKEKQNENEFLLIPSSPHHLIPLYAHNL